jgi:hypothetical protein
MRTVGMILVIMLALFIGLAMNSFGIFALLTILIGGFNVKSYL